MDHLYEEVRKALPKQPEPKIKQVCEKICSFIDEGDTSKPIEQVDFSDVLKKVPARDIVQRFQEKGYKVYQDIQDAIFQQRTDVQRNSNISGRHVKQSHRSEHEKDKQGYTGYQGSQKDLHQQHPDVKPNANIDVRDCNQGEGSDHSVETTGYSSIPHQRQQKPDNTRQQFEDSDYVRVLKGLETAIVEKFTQGVQSLHEVMTGLTIKVDELTDRVQNIEGSLEAVQIDVKHLQTDAQTVAAGSKYTQSTKGVKVPSDGVGSAPTKTGFTQTDDDKVGVKWAEAQTDEVFIREHVGTKSMKSQTEELEVVTDSNQTISLTADEEQQDQTSPWLDSCHSLTSISSTMHETGGRSDGKAFRPANI